LSNGKIHPILKKNIDWKVSLIDTGLNTMTGGRLKKLERFITDETFMLTYGDGLCDVDLNKLLQYHKKNKKIVTVTAVHPLARFGELTINNNNEVVNFREKPQTLQGWINGGYFVINREFFNFIDDNEKTVLEKEPLERVVDEMQLSAFKHNGFWQCMDTKRDKDKLEVLYTSNDVPWLKND
jgi:glucose-1-phosphate cytidylyltransferase